MSSKKEGAITAEVDGRLDDLFGEGEDDEQMDFSADQRADADDSETDFAEEEEAVPQEVRENTPALDAENSLIKDLKSVILSLEWEITDQVMQKLGEEIDKLKASCKNDKIIVAFLQLLESLGIYIQKKKAESHPDSISLLNSVYDHLEKVMLSPDLTEAVRKDMLLSQVGKYKELKVHIASGSRIGTPIKPEGAKKKPSASKKASAGDGGDSSAKTFIPDTEPSVVDIQEEDDDVPGGRSHQEDMIVHLLKEIHKTIKSELRAIRKELRNQ